MTNVDPTDGIWFSIHIENEEFIAFVSAESLRIHFKADGRSSRQLLRAYNEHQWHIDSVARRKFLNGAARPVRLTVADFY